MLDPEIERKIKAGILKSLTTGEFELAGNQISRILDELYTRIPQNKRISYGVVYTIKVLSEYLYNCLTAGSAPVYQLASGLLDKSDSARAQGVALGIMSLYGLCDYKRVLPHFEAAAANEDWLMREFAQMFFRKVVKRYPEETRLYLLKLAESEDANIRRFVAETLRPVRENGWFYQNQDYPLSILRKLFRETSPYARASVGNNLSDLARRLPDLVYGLVDELVKSGDRNSYWIAYRACRNLVKKDPIKVMNLLEIDEYKYKQRVYKRSDYPGN